MSSNDLRTRRENSAGWNMQQHVRDMTGSSDNCFFGNDRTYLQIRKFKEYHALQVRG